MARTVAPPNTRPPATLVILAVIQFLAAAVGCIVLLGNGTLDGVLDPSDIALAIATAIGGSAIVGITWTGLKPGWYVQLVLAPAAMLWGGLTLVAEEAPGPVAIGVGFVWLILLVLPPSRDWFVRQ